jgi:hypothetical protein
VNRNRRVVRRIDSGFGHSCFGRTGAGRSQDRRSRDSPAMGHDRPEAGRAGAALVGGGRGADRWSRRSCDHLEDHRARRFDNHRGTADLDAQPLAEGAGSPGRRRASCALRDGSALTRLVEPATLYDPMRPLFWVSKSMQKLVAMLTEMGHRSAPMPCARRWRSSGSRANPIARRMKARSMPMPGSHISTLK